MITSAVFYYYLPEFFLLSSALIILLYNAFIVSFTNKNFPLLDRESYIQSLFILFISAILCAINEIPNTSINGFFVGNSSLSLVKLIILMTSIGALICGQPYILKNKINLFEYYILYLLSIFSLLFLVDANDLVSIYLCLEMQSLCFYVLAAFNRNSIFSTEAGLKYFVLGAFSSCFFLFGSTLLYGLTGTTNLNNLAILLTDLTPSEYNIYFIYVSLFSILLTFFFKIAAAPFHVWSPDVYEGAPLSSTIIFVLVPKIVFVIIIAKISYGTFYDYFSSSHNFFLQNIFLCFGTLSVLLGSLAAIQQKRIKRLLIYSSITHVGFILLAFATGSLFGLVSIIYYIIFYIITGLLIWGIISLLNSENKNDFIYLTDFSALATKNPAKAICLGLAFFSMAGVPPLVGFSMKFFIFSAAFQSNIFSISTLIILLSVVSSFYYLRFIKIMFFETNLKKKNLYFSINISELNFSSEFVYVLVSLCFFLIFFGFINPNVFIYLSYKIVFGLF